MIQELATRYQRRIALPLLAALSFQLLWPLTSAANGLPYYRYDPIDGRVPHRPAHFSPPGSPYREGYEPNPNAGRRTGSGGGSAQKGAGPYGKFIGGPSSPEASSFKAVGSNNLVNLFTGDFSYSIPLLDVGGYPVNLFYNGGVTMDQEASWVGLGWNINPGTVTRNMRGVPDDFNGTDYLTQIQNVKPNRTWGGEIGVDGELIGIKRPKVNLSLGVSYNNYLGPALDVGATLSLSIASIEAFKSEKSAPYTLGVSAKVGGKLSSRSGLTLSPSLNANLPLMDKKLNVGAGLSTSYNSRTGIKSLTLNSEMTYYASKTKEVGEGENKHTVTGTMQYGGAVTTSNISFAKPSFMPVMRMPMQSTNFSGQLEFGLGANGPRGSIIGSGYYSESKVAPESRMMKKPLVGYMYSEAAVGNDNVVMDFNRSSDGEVTPNTPVISAPQYTYDVFSIQGEGTGGTIRAYRSDMGYMKDNVTSSKDKNTSIGLDIAPPGHFGGNWNIVSTPTRVGPWDDANNTLRQSLSFRPLQTNSELENVYFRNPGEATVTNTELLQRIGRDNLVRFELSGTGMNPRLETRLEQFNKKTSAPLGTTAINPIQLSKRERRTQVTQMLTAAEAARGGLDTAIYHYSGGFSNNGTTIQRAAIPRVGGMRKAHHISEIDVLEQSGMRYVYGLPVYSVTQQDYTFSVTGVGNTTGLVAFTPAETSISSPTMENRSRIDGYVQNQITPAFASSFLLTGLLSPDYVDVTGNGITEDDLGNAVKFDYTKSPDNHRWRTPRSRSMALCAHFNEGLKTEQRDNKASFSYGEREVWYMSAIESKTLIAIFTTEGRKDAKGVIDSLNGGTNTTENANRRLQRIDLYSKAEINAKGISNAKPLKTVKFEYDYTLCIGTPDNVQSDSGKLTLKAISFSYNGQTRAVKERYVFNYGNPGSTSDNPAYANGSSDKWGTYKPAGQNPSGLNNADFPYVYGDSSAMKSNAGAWSLRKILLPSGGQMEIEYESDDYGYVQNRRACQMTALAGLGKTTSYSGSPALYNTSFPDNEYIYVALQQPLKNTTASGKKAEIYATYLETLRQLAFRLRIQMPKGVEPLTAYAEFDDWGPCPNNSNYFYVHMKPVDGKSPLANSAIGFLTESLPGQAFPGYDVEINGIGDFIGMVGNMLGSLKNAFKNVDEQMRSGGNARSILLDKSFVRLAAAGRKRLGGGYRVKSVVVKDNWNKMTGQYGSRYGQEYDYTTTENIGGVDTRISSGVASYEPGVGSEENPFREIVAFSNKLPMASAQYGAIEMPLLESLYPSPGVGYSKVTVRSIHRKGTHSDSTLRSAIGKQVTEYFTAKDYPTYSSFTPMASLDYHKDPAFNFFYKELMDKRTVSQGFLVETNDMHGKMKAQLAYSESDENTPLSYTQYAYKNTGRNGLNDQVNFVYNNLGGAIQNGNMGVDVEMMTDSREFLLKSNGFNGQVQVDLFFFFIVPFPLPTMFPLKTYVENRYRAVTCTKLINYHAIEDSVIVMDKGSAVSTKTIAYDAETGAPLITETRNEFNDPIYKTSYPAYWAYSGMGLAYKNAGARYSGVTFFDGRLTAGASLSNFESGDELLITSLTAPVGGCAGAIASPLSTRKIWVLDKNKSTTSLTVPVKDLVFLENNGKPFTANNVSFRIIRSGHRNLLGEMLASVTSLTSPIRGGYLVIDSNSRVLTTTASFYKEKWSNECMSPSSSANPYFNGLLGNFKPSRTFVYYGNRTDSTLGGFYSIRTKGYLANYSNYWKFNALSNLVPDTTNPRWVWNSELINSNTNGLELETKDPLNRYTSVQYGFHRNLAMAVAQNAQDNEMAFEGFEDNGFNATINGTAQCAARNKFGTFQKIVSYAGVVSNPNGVSYHVTPTSGGDQNVSVAFRSTPGGTCSTSLLYYDGSAWISAGTGGVTSPQNFTVPANVSDYQFKFDCSNVTVGLNSTLTVMPFRAHSGTKALLLFPNESETIPLYVNNYGTSYNTDSIRFKMDTGRIQTVQVNPTNPGVITTGTVTTNYSPTTNQGWGTPGGNYVAGTTISTNCTPGGSCSGGSFTGSFSMSGYYVPTTTTPIQFYIQGDQQFTLGNACGNVVLSAGGGGVFVTDENGNTVASGGTGGGTINGRISYSLPSFNYQVGKVYKIQANGTFYGNMPTCTYPTGMDLKIAAYAALQGSYYPVPCYQAATSDTTVICSSYTKPIEYTNVMLNPPFGLSKGKRMLFSAWVRQDCGNSDGTFCLKKTYDSVAVVLKADGSNFSTLTLVPSGPIIEGWQKIEGEFSLPANFNYYKLDVVFQNRTPGFAAYFDDIRIHPYNANMKSYAYEQRTLRVAAELDENNFATFYEYDEEGQLVRIKKETIQGIKTIKETRSAKQKDISDFQ